MRKTKRTEIIRATRRVVVVQTISGPNQADDLPMKSEERPIPIDKEKKTMNNRTKSTLLTILCATACLRSGLAQTAPPTILEVDVENFVSYVMDTPDVTKYATLPNITPAAVPKNFYTTIALADIVAVNGRPAKGTLAQQILRLNLTPNPNPGDSA